MFKFIVMEIFFVILLNLFIFLGKKVRFIIRVLLFFIVGINILLYEEF